MPVACPLCEKPARTFNGGQVLFCPHCLVTGKAGTMGRDYDPFWSIFPIDQPIFIGGTIQTRPRVLEAL